MAVLYFGASHITRSIYMLPDGEYCNGDGSLRGQDILDEYHGVFSCWGCGGAGVVKMYLSRGYELVQCDVCQGQRTSSLMPKLEPRHIHDWQPSEDKAPPRFEPFRCACGALWLKKREREASKNRVAGLLPLAAVLPKEGT